MRRSPGLCALEQDQIDRAPETDDHHQVDQEDDERPGWVPTFLMFGLWLTLVGHAGPPPSSDRPRLAWLLQVADVSHHPPEQQNERGGHDGRGHSTLPGEIALEERGRRAPDVHRAQPADRQAAEQDRKEPRRAHAVSTPRYSLRGWAVLQEHGPHPPENCRARGSADL